ncbi:MAG: phosphoglucomutase/phosphomannomutase family protein [Candidatus Coatesbacteria bacterium]
MTRHHGIAFGTDGWRGIIAEAFTVDRLHVVAQAFADWMKRKGHERGRLLVGYDGRYGGERFALHAGRVLAGNGFRVDVTAGPVPTPAVSWRIPQKGYAAGLMITASHNPPSYSGVKVKPEYGGSPDETVIHPIVTLLGKHPPRFGETRALRRVEYMDEYAHMLRGLVDRGALRKLRGTVVSDPMGGAQAGIVAKILKGLPLKVVAIHDVVDPMFCGLASPEPVEKNLGALKAEVRRRRAILGMATDGDGDRIALVADGGAFVTPHLVFALLLLFMVRERHQRGGVVKTVSGSFVLDRIVRKHGLPLYETPVGFKHICKLMREQDILMGGEESGGVGVRGYIPERDGVLSGLLALEMLARTGKSCRQLVADLAREFGTSAYDRIDTHHETAQASLKRLIASPPSAVAGAKVARVNALDGLKLIFGDDSWLLFRASGTEPLLRIYAESDDPARTRRLLAAGAKLAGVRR